MKKLTKNAGFTLVELIVVIAILGILAGVGTVAYTGYVEKAKEAADQQLLSAVNMAYASTCVEKNVDQNSLTVSTAYILLDSDGKVTTVYAKGDATDTFNVYYSGNEDAAFATAGSLTWDKDAHVFVLGLSNEQVELLQKYYGKFTAKTLTETFDSLSTYGSGFLADMAGTNFWNTLAGYYGVTLDQDILTKLLNDEKVGNTEYDDAGDYFIAKLIEEGLIDDEDVTLSPDRIIGNAVVFYAAQNSQNVTYDSMMALLNGGMTKGDDGNYTVESSASNLGNIATLYGLYLAYDKGTGGEVKTGVNDVLDSMNNNKDAFKSWMKSSEGEEALAAYQASMEIIASSNSTDVLEGEFAKNEGILSLLTQLLGSRDE